MRLAVVLLSCAMALPSQTPEKPVQKNQTGRKTGNASQQQETHKTAPTASGVSAAPSAQESQSKANDHQHESDNRVYKVNVVSQPPAGEPLFIWYLIATIVGVVVNAAILFAIWRQTKINWRQVKVSIRAARAAGTSARAAKASTEVLIIGQKPQLSTTANSDPWKSCVYPPLGIRHLEIALHNTGLTTAYDCSWESWLEVLEFPFVDFTSAAEHTEVSHNFSLSPNTTAHSMVINIPIKRQISEPELDGIRSARLKICVRLCVKYRDSFNPRRYANFGYFVGPGGLGTLPKYNDSD